VSSADERRDRVLDEVADDLAPREREELAARLAMTSQLIDPSPAVRERVMARIARVEAPERGRAAPRWRSAAGLAAAAALGGLLALTWLRAETPGSEAEPGTTVAESAAPAPADDEEIEELEAMLAEQDGELASLESQLRGARDALSVLTAERVERLDLAPAGSAEAHARVYWDWDDYSCYFVARGLPASGDEARYALWLYTDQDEVVLAGRFAASARDGASFFAMLPKEMGKVVRAVVTEEPDADSEAPSGPVLMAGGGGPARS
jgi:hypothetical protein